MRKSVYGILASLLVLTVLSVNGFAHCEVPCGIYDDAARIKEIREHITTIEKAMKQINKLKNGDNPNQLVRWIVTKENHANDIQHIVAQYFMTQRIKTGAAQYNEKLGKLHEMLVYSMKCKQTVDLDQAAKLRAALDAFEKLYKLMTTKRHVENAEAERIGAALGLDWAQVDLEQFRIGLEVELEHGSRDPETNVTDDDMILTGKIALAHIREFPDYYTRLEKMEAEAEEFWAEKQEKP